jgi:hypothetical protein
VKAARLLTPTVWCLGLYTVMHDKRCKAIPIVMFSRGQVAITVQPTAVTFMFDDAKLLRMPRTKICIPCTMHALSRAYTGYLVFPFASTFLSSLRIQVLT